MEVVGDYDMSVNIGVGDECLKNSEQDITSIQKVVLIIHGPAQREDNR